MTDILISLTLFAGFAGGWALLFKAGAFVWLIDARMEAARAMLASTRFAFDGEAHGCRDLRRVQPGVLGGRCSAVCNTRQAPPNYQTH